MTAPLPLILVADDDMATTVLLQRIFERANFRVHCTYDGESAVAAAQTLQPDIVVLDIQMPRMNGFEVLHQLRANAQTQHIPTIIVTAQAREPMHVAEGLALGADDYLYKPFAPQELIARVQVKLRARQLEVALQRRSQELEALLHLSEALNIHRQLREVLAWVAEATFNLLACDGVLALHADEHGDLGATEQRGNVPPVSEETLHTWLHRGQTPDGLSLYLVPFRYGERILGALVINGSDTVPVTERHDLLLGIARQAALALSNAELYEIQANYALHLEDKVAARTQELRSVQHMLWRSEKLASIGRLAASIAHEINNPLQAIQLTLEDVQHSVAHSQVPEQEVITLMLDSVARISDIVRRVLEFTRTSRVEAKAPTALQDLARTILKLNQQVMDRGNVRAHLDFDPMPDVVVSKAQIEQVFLNLVLNAIEAMPGGGVLTVRGWADPQWAYVQFRDTGPGIASEMAEALFEPFATNKPNGTGLGLFVCHSIIESHQGRIDVWSKSGEGAAFTVVLPLAPTATAR